MNTHPIKLLVVEPQFVPRRTIVLSAARLQLAEVDESASLGAAERLLQGRRYAAVVLALDAGPLPELERVLAACAPAHVIGIQAPGQPAPARGWRPRGVHALLDKPARIKELLSLLSPLAAQALPCAATAAAALAAASASPR